MVLGAAIGAVGSIAGGLLGGKNKQSTQTVRPELPDWLTPYIQGTPGVAGRPAAGGKYSSFESIPDSEFPDWILNSERGQALGIDGQMQAKRQYAQQNNLLGDPGAVDTPGRLGILGAAGDLFYDQTPFTYAPESQYSINATQDTVNKLDRAKVLDAAYGGITGILENQGLNQGLNQAYSTADQIGGALGGYDDIINMDPINNPYVQDYIRRGTENISENVNSVFNSKGRYGSGVHQGVLADSIGDFETQTFMPLYESGMNRKMNAMGSKASGLGALSGIYGNLGAGQNATIMNAAGMTPGTFSSQFLPEDMLYNLGDREESRLNRNNQLAYELPRQNIDWMQGVLNPYLSFGSQTQINSQPGTSRIEGALGGGLAALGAYGQFAGGGSNMGALGGYGQLSGGTPNMFGGGFQTGGFNPNPTSWGSFF